MFSTFRVVLVDDDDAIRFLWAELLRRSLDFQVVGQAADGREGLALCQKHRPDAVVTDWIMPGIDGMELARRLRSDCPEMIVVLSSSYPATCLPEDLASVGVPYLPKAESNRLPALLTHLLTKPNLGGLAGSAPSTKA